MKIIYLAAHKAQHPNWDVDYQDITGKRDIPGDMMDVDLSPYDVIIATPPCNYWSRANYRREQSKYSLMTKYLLPGIILRMKNDPRPFIIENVINNQLMNQYGLMNCGLFVYEHGRHTYWTNVPFNPSIIPQERDFAATNTRIPGQRGKFMSPDGRILKSSGQIRISKNPQGGDNVHKVIEYWLEVVKSMKEGEET